MNSATPFATNLASRLRLIRSEIFGEGVEGIETLADELGLPSRIWAKYEAGFAMPATVMVCFLVLTRVNPSWLLDGSGNPMLEEGEKSINSDRFSARDRD